MRHTRCFHQSAFLLLFLLGTMSACTLGPNFEPPQQDSLMQQWDQAADLQLFTAQQPQSNWWEQFHDPILNSLIDDLFNSSLALKQARQRVVEVSARQGIVSADSKLQLAAALNYTRVKTGDEAVSLQGIPAGQEIEVYASGLVGGWEFDLWGRSARLVEAAQADIRAANADYRGMLISLAAETALAYCDTRTAEARIALLTQRIELQRAELDLARTRVAAGITNELTALKLEQLLENSRAGRPQLTTQLVAGQNRIKRLLGQAPTLEHLAEGPLPEVPQLIGTGIPADLMTRRPDITRALSNYHAAVARIGAAKAEQYPNLSLSGSLTLSSDSIGGMLDSTALIYSLGPQLKFPLLTGKRIESSIAVRQSQAQQARLALEQTLIAALSEVATGIRSVVGSQQQLERLTQAELLSAKAVELADSLYQAGLSDQSQLLANKQNQLTRREALLTAQQQALSATISLYRALGGGWEQAPAALPQSDNEQHATHAEVKTL